MFDLEESMPLMFNDTQSIAPGVSSFERLRTLAEGATFAESMPATDSFTDLGSEAKKRDMIKLIRDTMRMSIHGHFEVNYSPGLKAWSAYSETWSATFRTQKEDNESWTVWASIAVKRFLLDPLVIWKGVFRNLDSYESIGIELGLEIGRRVSAHQSKK